MRFYHDNAEICHGADTRDLGVGFHQKIVCGKFVDEPRPTFLELKDRHYEEMLGEKYVPMSVEGGMIHA
jgi:hypothetical protein